MLMFVWDKSSHEFLGQFSGSGTKEFLEFKKLVPKEVVFFTTISGEKKFIFATSARISSSLSIFSSKNKFSSREKFKAHKEFIC